MIIKLFRFQGDLVVSYPRVHMRDFIEHVFRDENGKVVWQPSAISIKMEEVYRKYGWQDIQIK